MATRFLKRCIIGTLYSSLGIALKAPLIAVGSKLINYMSSLPNSPLCNIHHHFKNWIRWQLLGTASGLQTLQVPSQCNLLRTEYRGCTKLESVKGTMRGLQLLIPYRTVWSGCNSRKDLKWIFLIAPARVQRRLVFNMKVTKILAKGMCNPW